MDGDVFDFMKIWTQGDQDSERKMKDVLLDGLDSVIQAESDVGLRSYQDPAKMLSKGRRNASTRFILWPFVNHSCQKYSEGLPAITRPFL